MSGPSISPSRSPIGKGTTRVTEVYSPESGSHPTTRLSQIRESIREPAAEFLGVMVFVMFGNGVLCQTQLSRNASVAATTFGDYLSVCFGFAVGLALGAWVTGGYSQGHINPAVTIAMATFRRDFPWRKVPGYILGQVLGGLCGAAVIYGNYIHAIDLVEGGRDIRTVPGTAGLFGTYALPYMTAASAWFQEFLGTAIILIVVCALGDVRNRNAPPGLAPFVLFIMMLGISAALGMQTGFAMNPARDLGPRLLTAMVGYGAPVFTFRNQYWLWCPILAPIVGALGTSSVSSTPIALAGVANGTSISISISMSIPLPVGTFLYDLVFYGGADSILSKVYVMLSSPR
uniref:A necrosis toxin (Ptr necrosis toxin) (ToxA) (Toxin A) n=1 Tax=Ganoderma boninense TaxID=34458 RepID=A0A5K1JZ25_9APHY|nr:A necrosis toxin (Ptr necrosis toxin) (ToxA) (Toxin A) [Ganoderma boninense]